MISINTNLSSLIARHNFAKSTSSLNTAIERMSTGFKLNHASDNAANYSISTDISTKISAYNIAEENTIAGIDLINTASDSLDLAGDKLLRLRALAEQAANGTYGKQQLKAINSEAKAIVNEISRLYANTEYNGIKLFGEQGGSFINTIERLDTSEMDKLADVDESKSLTSGTYSISSAEELAKLAKMTNTGKIGTSCVFVLAGNIDLSEYKDGSGWTPIGEEASTLKAFRATFDGNGYTISNLYISDSDKFYNGIFGVTINATIKNVSVKNVDIHSGSFVGALVGYAKSSTILNCNSMEGTVAVVGIHNNAGGLVGATCDAITMSNCYSSLDVNCANWHGGGLIVYNTAASGTISNCFATGTIQSENGSCGGLIGTNSMSGTISNCFSTSDVIGGDGDLNGVGGIIGYNEGTGTINLTSCYSTGDVSGKGQTAGLVGHSYSSSVNITDCFSTGTITSRTSRAAGFLGNTANATIGNSYSLCTIVGSSGSGSGGLIAFSSGTVNINSSYYSGNITCKHIYSGGLIGCAGGKTNITNSYTSGSITSDPRYVGGLVGGFTTNSGSIIKNSYSTMHVETKEQNLEYVGGLVGYAYGANVQNSYYSLEDSGMNDNLGKGQGVSRETLNNLISNGTLVPSGFKLEEFDLETTAQYSDQNIGLQVGISGADSSRIEFSISLGSSKIDNLRNLGIKGKDYFNTIDDEISKINRLQTASGAIGNRLESVLEEISTQYDNLTSNRSTIRDADVAKVSSEYIRQQILQEASATLLATANQSPALALQLL